MDQNLLHDVTVLDIEQKNKTQAIPVTGRFKGLAAGKAAGTAVGTAAGVAVGTVIVGTATAGGKTFCVFWSSFNRSSFSVQRARQKSLTFVWNLASS